MANFSMLKPSLRFDSRADRCLTGWPMAKHRADIGSQAIFLHKIDRIDKLSTP
jgi:hypothetical protein